MQPAEDPEDEDLPLDLPPLGRADEQEDEQGDAVDVVDVDADFDAGGSEQIGLDAAEGPEDPEDPTELIDTGSEGESYTEENEDAGELAGDALEDMAEGSEYGWTEGTEEPHVDDWEEDVDEIEEAPALGDDEGEEGVDDPFVSQQGDEDAFPGLPAMDADTDESLDEEASDLELEGEDEIEGPALSYQEEARLMGSGLPEEVDTEPRSVALVPGSEGQPVTAVACSDDELFVVATDHVGSGPWEGPLEAFVGYGLEEQTLTSLAVDPERPERIAVGTALGGVLRSLDGGRTFEPADGWRQGDSPSEVACYVTAEPRSDGGVRLWLRTRGGALYRSEDFGSHWTGPVLAAPVAALAADPEGGMIALCVSKGTEAQLCHSTDGGVGWRQYDVPEVYGPVGEAGFFLTGCGSTVVLTREDDARPARLSTDGGGHWRPLEGLPNAGPVTLVREQPGALPTLYAALYLEGADRGVVVRQPLGSDDGADVPAPDALIVDVAAERRRRAMREGGDPEGDNRILTLVGRREQGQTVLYVGSGLGLLRVAWTSRDPSSA
jgi:hypothetical protein